MWRGKGIQASLLRPSSGLPIGRIVTEWRQPTLWTEPYFCFCIAGKELPVPPAAFDARACIFRVPALCATRALETLNCW